MPCSFYFFFRQKGKGIPPAWDYNPSTWDQRIPLVIVALIGFCIAVYLGLYQLRVVPHAWDPFFGNDTEKVLDSKVSKMVPFPDALMGAFGYLLDVETGVIGGTLRWKTKLWIVIIFGIAVGPLGLVSILLVISQPVLVKATEMTREKIVTAIVAGHFIN
ncbi:MAG: vitamin K epoxide reductase [Flavisolibacter sp.]|nr:vitamin K epoxide reductase [Flavisolibacter sp.]